MIYISDGSFFCLISLEALDMSPMLLQHVLSNHYLNRFGSGATGFRKNSARGTQLLLSEMEISIMVTFCGLRTVRYVFFVYCMFDTFLYVKQKTALRCCVNIYIV